MAFQKFLESLPVCIGNGDPHLAEDDPPPLDIGHFGRLHYVGPVYPYEPVRRELFLQSLHAHKG